MEEIYPRVIPCSSILLSLGHVSVADCTRRCVHRHQRLFYGIELPASFSPTTGLRERIETGYCREISDSSLGTDSGIDENIRDGLLRKATFAGLLGDHGATAVLAAD